MFADVKSRVGSSATDKTACVGVGSYWEPDTTSEMVTIRNTIAAGCRDYGFVVPGHSCDEENTSFVDNVAHSGKRSGARIYPHGDGSQLECFQGSRFSAYHNVEQGLLTRENSAEIKMSNMTFIANRLGWNINGVSKTQIKVKDIHTYAEPIDQVPSSCGDVYGFWATAAASS